MWIMEIIKPFINLSFFRLNIKQHEYILIQIVKPIKFTCLMELKLMKNTMVKTSLTA